MGAVCFDSSPVLSLINFFLLYCLSSPQPPHSGSYAIWYPLYIWPWCPSSGKWWHWEQPAAAKTGGRLEQLRSRDTHRHKRLQLVYLFGWLFNPDCLRNNILINNMCICYKAKVTGQELVNIINIKSSIANYMHFFHQFSPSDACKVFKLLNLTIVIHYIKSTSLQMNGLKKTTEIYELNSPNHYPLSWITNEGKTDTNAGN